MRSTFLGMQSKSDWDTKYNELVSFYRTHGHTYVKSKGSMYKWTLNQRNKRVEKGQKSSLTDEQIRLLDEIDFPWSLKGGRSSRAWYIRYRELVDFYEKHVHLNVGYKSSMYQWMTTQRKKLCGKGPTFATHG